VPRYDHDEPADDHQDHEGTPVWRRRLFTSVLAALGLGLGFLFRTWPT
jgi:hypothetical protein